MKSRKGRNSLSNLRFSLLLTLFSLFTLAGCSACGSSTPKDKKTKPRLDNQDNQADSKKVIVLFHGLNCPEDLKDLETQLAKDLADCKIIRLVRENSTQVPTTQQAEEMYGVLKKQLSQKGLVNPAICLIGDSHGGLVALEMYRLHKDDLNIKGIITNHSPLEGAPGVNASPEAIIAFIEALKNIIPSNIKDGINSMLKIINAGATLDGFLDNLDLKSILADDIQEPVRQDLTTNSTLLENIKSTLSSTKIPILLLVGKVNIKTGVVALLQFAFGGNPMLAGIIQPFKESLDQLPPDDPKLVQLETTFGEVIGSKENDCFVPFYSQVAKHIQTSSTVNALCSSIYHHFYEITHHQKLYPRIVEFINKAFEAKK